MVVVEVPRCVMGADKSRIGLGPVLKSRIVPKSAGKVQSQQGCHLPRTMDGKYGVGGMMGASDGPNIHVNRMTRQK